MTRPVLIFAVTFALGGCEYLHKPESTRFEKTEGGFTFRAIADAAYPESSTNGEAWRMRWLEQKLRDSGSCLNGYSITSRRPLKLSTGALGSITTSITRGGVSDATRPNREVQHADASLRLHACRSMTSRTLAAKSA